MPSTTPPPVERPNSPRGESVGSPTPVEQLTSPQGESVGRPVSPLVETVGSPVTEPDLVEIAKEGRRSFLTLFFSILFAVTTAMMVALIFLISLGSAGGLSEKVILTLIGATITQTGAMIGVIITATFKEGKEEGKKSYNKAGPPPQLIKKTGKSTAQQGTPRNVLS